MTSLSQSTVPEPVEALPGAHSPDPGAPQRRSAGKGGVGQGGDRGDRGHDDCSFVCERT